MSELRHRARRAAVLLALACVVSPPAARAATIRLINRDGPGEGFNDPSPVAPVGGNTGTTLGEQRLIAFQHAVDIWATVLDSPVEIRISATFDPLQCDSNSVTLGQAGPVSVFAAFAGAPDPDTFYPSALADRLAGMDLATDEDDIEAQFNSSFGTTCAFPAGWYYGLDGNRVGEDSDLVTVVLHELGHGMGFLTFVDIHSGARLYNTNDAFMKFLVDDRTGKTFPEMTDAERQSAIVATGHLKWNGAQVEAASGGLTTGADASGRVEIYAPNPPEDGSSTSHWSDDLFPNELMEPIFVEPIHVVGLAAPALMEMGWGAEVTAPCPGDCNGDRAVAINELVTCVGIVLGTVAADACAACDADGNGTVAVNDLVASVGRALNGCDPSPAATPTPTATVPTATTTIGPSPTATTVGTCPVNFRDDSLSTNILCLYAGRWNMTCGDNMLEASFSSDGNVFLAVLGTDPLIGLAGNVTSTTAATLAGWFTDFANLSDFQAISGTASLSGGGSMLAIQPDSAPFAINACAFADYMGTFTGTAQTGSFRQVDAGALLPLVRAKLAPR